MEIMNIILARRTLGSHFPIEETQVKSKAAMWKVLREFRDSLTPEQVGFSYAEVRSEAGLNPPHGYLLNYIKFAYRFGTDKIIMKQDKDPIHLAARESEKAVVKAFVEHDKPQNVQEYENATLKYIRGQGPAPWEK